MLTLPPHLNGGFFSALAHAEWRTAWDNVVFAMTTPLTQLPREYVAKMLSSVALAALTSAATLAGSYAIMTARIDERVAALQHDLENKSTGLKEADGATNLRIQRLEDRFTNHDVELAKQLAAIREELGRLDGKSQREETWRRAH